MVPRFVLVLLTVLAASVPAGADDIWDQPALSTDPRELLEWAAGAAPEAAEGAVLLFRGLYYRLDDQARVEQRTRLIYRIDSESMVPALAYVDVSWRPWHQARPEIGARVITREGTVHVLNPDDLGEYSADSSGPELFGDAKALRGPLPAVAPGAVIEVEYIIRDTEAFFEPGGTVALIPLGVMLPAVRTRIVVDAPTTYPLRYVARLLPALEVETTEADGRVRMEFDHGPLPVADSMESHLPDDVPPLPFIGFTTVPDWRTVASGYAEVVDLQLQGTNVSKLVNKTLRNVADRDDRIERLLEAVQDRVRYTGVEFGARAIVPASPQTTLQRGFGDCKDKATLLAAMLRQAGIEARVALLSTGPGFDVDPELPGLELFDHAIVQITGTPPVWIDPTHRYARAGELPVSDQGRLALIIDPSTTDLVETPEAASSNNRIIETREITLARRGGGQLTETTEWHGAFERMNREYYSALTGDVIDESFEGYLERHYGGGKLTDSDLSDVADLSTPLTLRLEAKDIGVAWTEPAAAWVLIPGGPLLGDLPEPFLAQPEPGESAEAPRRNDVALSLPYAREWRYVIHAPPGYVLRELPKTITHELGSGNLVEEFSADENGAVHATLRFDVTKNRYSAEEVREAARRIKAYGETDATLIVFDQVGEMHLAAGRVQEALAEFQRLAALYPDEALYRTQTSRALIAAGLGEAARREALRATELEADSTLAYTTLGLALSHDQLGRKHNRGFDLAGAEAAFRKAKELDPKDFEARGELAILLEHDADGERYGSGARLDEAIKEYEAIIEDLDDRSLVDNLLIALLRDGRTAEATTRAYDRRYTETGAIAFLAATAITDGPDAAIREAARVVETDDQGATLIATSEQLIQMRRYAEAAALIVAASKGQPDALARLSQADLLRGIRPWEELDFSAETPQGLIRRFFRDAFQDGGDAEGVFELFAAPVRRELGPEEIRDLASAMDFFRRAMRRVGLSSDGILDLVLSMAEISAEGDDAHGYRVRIVVVVPATGASQTQIAYVVREGDKCRLVEMNDPSGGVSKGLPAVGTMVLHWIEDEQLDLAKHWLDLIHGDTTSVREDDPLSMDPFRRLWTPGTETDAARMRFAAASLMTERPFSERAVEILEAGLESPETEDLEVSLGLALMRIALLSGDHELGVRVARQLLEIYPESGRAFGTLVGGLLALQRGDAAEEVAKHRLEQDPDDPFAAFALAEVALAGGDVETWTRAIEERISSGKASPADYNNLAWHYLGRGEVSEHTLGLAQRSVMLTNYSIAAFLHTLAACYAELDRPIEAREVLLGIIDLRERGELREPEDWYIFGRIAESYGVMDAARDAYLEVTPGEDSRSAHPTSYDLAQRRLSGL